MSSRDVLLGAVLVLGGCTPGVRLGDSVGYVPYQPLRYVTSCPSYTVLGGALLTLDKDDEMSDVSVDWESARVIGSTRPDAGLRDVASVEMVGSTVVVSYTTEALDGGSWVSPHSVCDTYDYTREKSLLDASLRSGGCR